jgi:hypothetical protein
MITKRGRPGRRWAAHAAVSPPRVHMVVDGRGLPLVLHVTAGNVNDSTCFEHVLEQIRIPTPGGGHPRTRPSRSWATRAIRPGAFAPTCAGAASAV